MSDVFIVKAFPNGIFEFLIKSSDKVSSIREDAAPGSVAYTADGTFLAMKDLDGTWQTWMNFERTEAEG